MLELAETIKSKRILQLQYDKQDLPGKTEFKLNDNYLSYFEKLADARFSSKGNYGCWDSALKHLKIHSGFELAFKHIDREWLLDFKDYLQNRARTKSNQPLSQNTIHTYFNKIRASLRQAVQDNFIPKNPAEMVTGFKQGETQREFLTLDELKKLKDCHCKHPVLKSAFLFSCLTGLRWSDIDKLIWKEVQYSKENGHYIRFRQQKTKHVETLPIPDQAVPFLGEENLPEERVFKGLKYSADNNLKLKQWVMRAGIVKDITFHCARHTYATLLLTNGTDLYTVSKLLGHKEIKTTQIYANIIDSTKNDAVHKLPKI